MLPDPDQDSAVLINGETLRLDKFRLQVGEVVVVELEAPFQRTIGDPPLALEESNNFRQDVVKLHRCLSACLLLLPRGRYNSHRALLVLYPLGTRPSWPSPGGCIRL